MSSNCELDSGDHKAQSPRSLVSNSQATSSLANNIGRNMTTNEHSRDNTETSFTSTTIPTSTRTRKQHYHHHHKAPHELMHVTSSSRSTKQAASAACSPSQQQQARQQQHYQKILNSLQKPPMIMAQTVRDNTNAYEQFLQNLGCQNAASPMAPRPIRTTTMTTTTTRTTSTIAPSCTLRQGYCRCCRLRARRCHARHSECRLVSSRTRSPVAIGMGMGMEVAKTTPLFMVEASVANIRDGAGYHGLSLDNNIHHQSHNHNFHHSHKSNDQQQQQRQQRQQQLEPIIKSSIYNDITNNENDSEIGSARQRQQDNQQLLTRATTATSQSQKKKLDRRHRKRQYSEMQAKPTVTTMMMMMAAAAAATAPTNDDHDDDESNPSLPYRIGPLSFMESGEIMKAGQAGQDKNKQIQAAIEEATISATSAYGAANQQTEPYQRRDQHGKLRASEAKRSAAASANRLEKRSKRHTIDHDDDYDSQLPSSNATVTTANQYGHQTTAAAGQLASLDCYKLATLWRYLQSSYPMLSGYLVELAVAKANGESGEQFQQQSAKSIQFARSIGQLLGDAERITAAAAASQQQQQPSSLLQVNYNKQSHNHNRHLPPGLARVYANPTYGKLVQYLRAQQQQQRPSTPSHQPAHRPTSSSSSSSSSGVVGPTTTWLQREDTGTNGNLNGPPGDDDREQMASLVQQQPSSSSSSSSSQEVYGRLIHYPHEIGRVDNSNGMARTLDKLRLLSHHSKQQQQQQQHQLSSGDIVEANRIQLAPDVDHISDTNWRKLDESAADLARNDIVYGTVLLRPSSPSSTNNNNRNDQEQGHPQHNSHNQQQQQQHNQRSPYHKPMSSLRELANERQRLMLMNGRPMTTQTESKTPIPSQMAIDGGTESDQTTADNDEEFEGEFHSGPLEQAELRLLSSSPDSHRSTTNGADKLMQPQVEPITKRTEFVLD